MIITRDNIAQPIIRVGSQTQPWFEVSRHVSTYQRGKVLTLIHDRVDTTISRRVREEFITERYEVNINET